MARRPQQGTAATERPQQDRAIATRERIMSSGMKLFAERGFAASSMRELADRAGVSLSASYYYFPGKHDVLVALMEEAMDQLSEAAREVLELDLDPPERLAALTAAHVRFHLDEPDVARVGDWELRSLQPEARERVLRSRDRYEAIFRRTLEAGVAAGQFSPRLDVPVTAMAIITMGTSTVDWWRPGARLSVDETANLFGELAVTMAVYGGLPVPPHGARELSGRG